MSKFQHKKAAQLLNYIVEQNGGSVEKMKAFKLIWLINRLHLRKYGRMVTNDNHYAMQHGPVPSNTSNCLEKNQTWANAKTVNYFSDYLEMNGHVVRSLKDADTNVFSKSDLEVINEILAVYGNLSSGQLRNLSHLYPEWKRFETKIESSGSSYLMEINDFFDSFDDGRGLFLQSKEYLDLIKEEYLENV